MPKSWLQIRGRALSVRMENFFSHGLCREGLAQVKPRCCSCVRVCLRLASWPSSLRSLLFFCFRVAVDKGADFSVSPRANGVSLWDGSGDASTQISFLRPGVPGPCSRPRFVGRCGHRGCALTHLITSALACKAVVWGPLCFIFTQLKITGGSANLRFQSSSWIPK